MFDPKRFILAQEDNYDVALTELRIGKKNSHWMWYIFPQLKALGFSYRSRFYGIEDLDEARAYLDDPMLGPRYLACVQALLAHKGTPPELIMGSVDSKKLRSSLTLMQLAGGGATVQDALNSFFGGQKCVETQRMIKA